MRNYNMGTREKDIRFELILLFAAGELILLFNAFNLFPSFESHVVCHDTVNPILGTHVPRGRGVSAFCGLTTLANM